MIGSRKAIAVDVRIISATNADLAALVKRGLFREDLYYRLNVITIAIPPLRERGDDLFLPRPPLRRALCAGIRKGAAAVHRLGPPCAATLQLAGQRARAGERDTARRPHERDAGWIEAGGPPALMRFTVTTGPRLDRSLAEVEAEHVAAVLASVGWKRSRAARIWASIARPLTAKHVTSKP